MLGCMNVICQMNVVGRVIRNKLTDRAQACAEARVRVAPNLSKNTGNIGKLATCPVLVGEYKYVVPCLIIQSEYFFSHQPRKRRMACHPGGGFPSFTATLYMTYEPIRYGWMGSVNNAAMKKPMDP